VHLIRDLADARAFNGRGENATRANVYWKETIIGKRDFSRLGARLNVLGCCRIHLPQLSLHSIDLHWKQSSSHSYY